MMEDTLKMELNNKRTINAWAMFDWANSSYALVIAVAIFPIYFNNVLADEFTFLGITVTDSSLFSYSLSFAYLIVALILPLLSGIADYGGRKLSFMTFFTFLGGIACMLMFFFEQDKDLESHGNVYLGVTTFVLAVIGFAGGQVFYNAYLPLIATKDRFDQVSAKGFSYGYIGSVLLLVFNLVMIQKPEWFGIDPENGWLAPRISFLMVGVWWIGFAQITFFRMPKEEKAPWTNKIMRRGFEELKKVWEHLKSLQNLKRFLISFFFYSAGVQTVIYLASTFAVEELKFEAGDLIIVILILQIVAIFGAYLFAYVSKLKGNIFSLMSMLIIWIIICIAAYFVQGQLDFYIIAAFVGLVMGGVQSMSRSTYSKLIPKGTKETASYFSFFDVLEKLAIVMGTFSFGFIEQITGGMRNSILALTVYFLIGIIFLAMVTVEKTKQPT